MSGCKLYYERRAAVKKTYQGTPDKSKQKFEVIGKREMLVEMPLPMVEVWEELQAEVEQLTGEAGLRIIGAILKNEVTRRVGPSHQPGPESGAVRWGRHRRDSEKRGDAAGGTIA